jgi:PncC family amidohydrolase
VSQGLPTPQELAERLAALLQERGEKLAVAEGATGGALSHLLTQVPGSSAWFRAGFVAYTDFPKQLILRVSTDTILEQGGISAEATVQMARLARRLMATDWGLAVTGYADGSAPVRDHRAQGVPDAMPASAERIPDEKRAPQAGVTFIAVAGSVEHPTEEQPDRHTWEERVIPAPDRGTYKEEAAAAAIEALLDQIANAPRPRANGHAPAKNAARKAAPDAKAKKAAAKKSVAKKTGQRRKA